MSLTSHLKNPASPIGTFIKQRFAHTTSLTKAANQQLKLCTTLRPVLTPGVAYPYAPIGMAIDYRLRYAFALTPYRHLVAWEGASLLAFQPLEDDDDIEVDWDELSGMLIPFDPTRGVAQGPYPLPFLRAFFERLNATLQVMQPVGKLLSIEEEQVLARYCYVLSLFEETYRSESYLHGPLLNPSPKQSIEALLAIPQQDVIDDLCHLFSLFYDHYHHLLSRPHRLNPTFAGSNDVGGADADLIVDGCLIDIKTSVNPKLDAEYVRQLAGYLLLDYNDSLHITSLGIYMARQGMLLTWTVEEFLRQLTGEPQVMLTALRQAFRLVCRNARKPSSSHQIL